MATSQVRYVIIGAGAAGMAAAGAILELDPKGLITVLSEEPGPPYFRPLIPFLISGQKVPSEIMLNGRGAFPANGIELRLSSRVEGLNTQAQRVFLEGGDEIPYDKVLLATGSRPLIPFGVKGAEAEGVFSLRTMADAEAIAQRAGSAGEVIMLGAGMLNLKAAIELAERGLDVTMVEQERQVLPRLMDGQGGALVREALSRLGIKAITGCTVTRIYSDASGVNGALLDNGQELPCQLVCIGVGTRPNVEFLEGSGIQVDQGVVADEFMACNIENVFTAGDVAATTDPLTGKRIVTGLWTNAVEMGRCAGKNMAGRPTSYPGSFAVLNASQVAHVSFVSMGVVHTDGTDYETHLSETGGSYRKLVFTPDGSLLVGAVLVGDVSRAGLYRYLIRERTPVEHLRSEILGHRLHYGRFLRH
ncbi:MAG: FAD-dependent oxidoreductase [Pseudomonadota bacterium]